MSQRSQSMEVGESGLTPTSPNSRGWSQSPDCRPQHPPAPSSLADPRLLALRSLGQADSAGHLSCLGQMLPFPA